MNYIYRKEARKEAECMELQISPEDSLFSMSNNNYIISKDGKSVIHVKG